MISSRSALPGEIGFHRSRHGYALVNAKLEIISICFGFIDEFKSLVQSTDSVDSCCQFNLDFQKITLICRQRRSSITASLGDLHALLAKLPFSHSLNRHSIKQRSRNAKGYRVRKA